MPEQADQPTAGGARPSAEGTAQVPQPLASEVFLQEEFLETGLRHNWAFILIALILHGIVFMITFPEIKYQTRSVSTDRKVLTVRKYTPPPPKQQPRKQIERKITQKVPVPDPTPEEPEPIIEPEPPPEPEPLPEDVEILIGEPEPPPVTGPLMPGLAGVSEPELIPETRVEPEYPELARRARIQGRVILRAVIKKDGSVADIEVLREPQANLGFSDAAISAVKQWRYRPAMQNGRPVDVYFTVTVNFTLD
ncbi:MAG: energy transducer TonB [Acidobacteriota bacterium]|nr:MAG: energy transducer TonB [Acidobacteriota bacterium]